MAALGLETMTVRELTTHDVKWTPELVRKFWSFYSLEQEEYFSFQVGDRLLDLVGRVIDWKDLRVLDFGCGPGFLLEKLLGRGAHVAGVDFSPPSVDVASARCKGNSLFLGASVVDSVPTKIPAESYDCVLFIETIEHLLEDEREATLRELHRLLRPGGWLLVTTPNRENLTLSMQVCSGCGCRFHRWQHQTSWNADSLSSLLRTIGFKERMVQTARLDRLTPGKLSRKLLDLAGRSARRTSSKPAVCPECERPVLGEENRRASRWRGKAIHVGRRALAVLGGEHPNLIYVGSK